ncbi:MAG: AMP-binding protein [Cyclobacteriaceae bacterium]
MATYQQPVRQLIVPCPDVQQLSIYKWADSSYISSVPSSESAESTFPPSDPQDTSYLYFTSGSTGQPKIVEGKLVSLSHFINWQANELCYEVNKRVGQLAATTFDASLKDILPTLLTGGVLCIPSEDVMANMYHLYQWLKDEQVQIFATVPSIFRALMQEMEANEEIQENALPEVQQILLAGEVLYRKDVYRWQKLAGKGAEIINLYGTTESTILKTFHRVPKIDDNQLEESLSVGKPIGNTAIIILNENLQLCSPNEAGEVYIKTPFLSKGYYNDPETTADIFVINPLTGNKNDIVYKTGDEGIYLNDGAIKLIGRKDKQVKLNGIRLNLSGISSSLLRNKSVDEVVCILHNTKEGDNHLVCYFTGTNISEKTIRQFAEEKLNKYEVPGYFIKLDGFPRNQHGKLDKTQLPDPLKLHKPSGKSVEADSLTETEKALKRIWEDFFKIDNIGPEDSFLQVGGNSLKALQVGAIITQKMKVTLGIAGIQQLFKKPVLKDFALYLDELKGTSIKKTSGIVKVPDEENYPVSYSQQQIYMACQSPDSNRAYNMPKAYKIKGLMQPDLFIEAFRQLTSRYEILRTSFNEIDGDIRQKIHPVDSITSVRYIDLQLEGGQESTLSKKVDECLSHVFDLSTPGQVRIYLIQLSAEDFVMAVNIHHLIGDSWSARLMASKLFETYVSLQSDKDVNNRLALPFQFREYAVWERQQLDPETVKPLKNYWTSHL